MRGGKPEYPRDSKLELTTAPVVGDPPMAGAEKTNQEHIYRKSFLAYLGEPDQ